MPYPGAVRRYPESAGTNPVENDDEECANRVDLNAPRQADLFD